MKYENPVEIFGFSNYNFAESSKLRTMDYHRHNSLEISYVLSGEMLMEYFDEAGRYQSFFLRENQLAISKPFVKHKTSVSIGLRSMGLELVAPRDVVGAIEGYLRADCPEIDGFFDGFKDVIVLRDSVNAQNTIKQFQNYVKSDERYSPLLSELEIKKLFVQILCCAQNDKIAKRFNRHVNNALLYIKQHFNKQIQSEQVAKSLGLSNVYFQRLFQQETGKKFTRYVNEQRIAYATTLVSTTNYPLAKIASMAGYNSAQSFISNFKLIQGKTPRQFREQVFDGYHVEPQSTMSALYQETVFKDEDNG